MKKHLYIIPILFLFSMLVTAQDKNYEFVIGGGIETPISPSAFSDIFDLGFTGKLAAGYFVSPQLALGANLSYNRFGLNESGFMKEIGVPVDPNLTISGGDLSIFEFAGVGKYYLMPRERSTNFYILGGPGVAVSRIGEITVKSPDGTSTSEDSSSETDFLLTGGIGLKQQLNSNLGLFVEGRYSYIFTADESTSYLPVRIGFIF